MGYQSSGKLYYGFYEDTEEDNELCSNEDEEEYAGPLNYLMNDKWSEVHDKLKELNLDSDWAGYGDSGTSITIIQALIYEASWGNMTELPVEELVKDNTVMRKSLYEFIDYFKLPEKYKERIGWWLTSSYG